MTALTGILPKLAVFLVATLVGGVAAFGVTSALNRPRLAPTAGIAPDYTLTSAGTIAAFDLIDAQRTPTVVSGLPAADLGAASAALIEDDPPAGTSPLGFPRVDPVSQFDGGDFAGANCTLAAGAMLARLGFGIVTSGSILRTLQSDQVGGTDLHDLQRAMFHGYGVQFSVGSLTPRQLKRLLAAGYGAVIQGVYSEIPVQLRLQPSFTGGHAIYLDGFYPGNGDIPAAYFVIDPIGRGHSYRGEWWPASVVDAFGLAFGGGNRIPAAWVFPPGGAPPPIIVPPNVPPLPPDEGDGSSPGGTPGPSGSGGGGEEPGTISPPEPVPPVTIDPGTIGGLDLIPFLTVCIVNPSLDSCPGGVEGVFVVAPPIFTLPLGPTINVTFVDSDRPNVALIGFTIDHPAPVNVRLWEADGTPATVLGPTSMANLTVLGEPTIVAELPVVAGTTYHYQVVAGDGLFTSVSPVGTFTTGAGVRLFETALATTTNPVLELGPGLSPFLHLGDGGGFAPPLLEMAGGVRPAGCAGGVLGFGSDSYCLADIGSAPASCQTVNVSYDLEGVGGSGVIIRAFPTTTGETRAGTPSLTGILEADGPPGSGDVAIGCLASGLTYSVVIDALGDDDGILASQTVVVP
jgi:hypothetical protein